MITGAALSTTIVALGSEKPPSLSMTRTRTVRGIGPSARKRDGTLTEVGAGPNWSPAPRLNLLTSFTREGGPPSLQQLGDPLLLTPNVSFFDATTGQSVSVTTLTGGNPDLDADRPTVWNLGGNWQPSEKLDLKLRADLVFQTIDTPQIGFPAATPALEAAFPDRFQRDEPGSALLVTLEPGAEPAVEPIRTGRFQWLVREWTVADANSFAADCERLLGQIEPSATLLQLSN